MANKRYRLTVPIDTSQGGTYWHSIGALWFDEHKDQMSMEFNSLPIPNKDGKVRVLAFPAEDEPSKGRREQRPAGNEAVKGTNWDKYLDDEIPF